MTALLAQMLCKTLCLWGFATIVGWVHDSILHPPPTLLVVAFCLQGFQPMCQKPHQQVLGLWHHTIALGYTLELT